MPVSYRARLAGKNVRARLTGVKRSRSGLSKVYSQGRMHTVATRQLKGRVNQLYRMIETKETGSGIVQNVQCAHNNTTVIGLNPLATNLGTGDPMVGVGQRIGDKVSVRGLKAKMFLEGAIGRSKVYFRIMLLKGPRAAGFNRADIYKGAANNKMLDDINTEKYSIIAQKIITVTPPNAPADALNVINGEVNAALPAGITGNRIVKFWIPGKKFGRGGQLTYEDSSSNVKFYDYRWVIVAYDWYGTPQDVNTVGVVNEFYSKMYFKDA